VKELVKIELKKMSLKKEIRNLVIANVVIPIVAFVPILADGGAMVEYAYSLVSLIILATFIVWQAVLISALVVDEFKSKTMMQLFTYPVKRATLIIAKVGLIFVLVLAFSLFTNLIQHSLFAGLSLFITNFSYTLSIGDILRIVVTSVSSVMLAMMTLTVGVWMKSTVAPVVTAFVLITVMGNINGFSLANNLVFMVMMGIVGVGCVMISINDIIKKDLIV